MALHHQCLTRKPLEASRCRDVEGTRMAENDEDDELGGLDASNAADRKILRSVLLINL